MALSGSFQSNTFGSGHYIFAEWSATQNVTSNYSVINIKVYLHRAFTWNSSTTKYGYVSIDGSQYDYNCTVGGGSGNQEVYELNHTISHGVDGRRTFGVTIALDPDVTLSGTRYGMQRKDESITLNDIPRTANITSFECVSTNYRTASLYWAADSTIDAVSYQINNGTWIYPSFAPNTSATFVIPNLSPATNYAITLSVKRKDSQIWSYKSLNFSTKFGASLTKNISTLTIGESLTITVNNPNNSYIKFLVHIEAENENGILENHTDVIVRNIGQVNGTYSTTFSNTELAEIYRLIKYSNTGILKIYYGSYESATENILWDDLFSKSGAGSITLNLNASIILPTLSSATWTVDSKTSTELANAIYLICGYSTLTVAVVKSSMVAKCSAILKRLVIECDGYKNTYDLTTSTSSFTLVHKPSVAKNEYKINVYVVDSRGNQSTYITKTYNIIPYHTPIIVPKMLRELSSGGVVKCTFTGQFSRLYTTSDKNSSTVKYAYSQIGSSYGSDVEINGYTQTDSANGVDKNISYVNNSILTLDVNKNYSFKFTIIDKLNTYVTSVDLVDGTPIMRILDNGQVGINCKPNTSTPNTKLAVNGDASFSGALSISGTNILPAIQNINATLETDVMPSIKNINATLVNNITPSIKNINATLGETPKKITNDKGVAFTFQSGFCVCLKTVTIPSCASTNAYGGVFYSDPVVGGELPVVMSQILYTNASCISSDVIIATDRHTGGNIYGRAWAYTFKSKTLSNLVFEFMTIGLVQK